MPTPIHYLGQSFTDHSVTFSINGVRWEYHLTQHGCHSVDWLSHKVSIGKALAYAKRHSLKAERVLNATV